jgi:hypothetical protein
LNAARRLHGSVFIGQAYSAAEALRTELVEELRGFRCIPEINIFSQEQAVRAALGQAKLAVHFLGDTDAEAANSVEAVQWSLEHCSGKTVAYLPPGRQLAPDERQLVDCVRNSPKWTQPKCTSSEFVQILIGELEGFRLPEPATALALACDHADLETVHTIALEIHERDRDSFAVSTPDFLAEPGALTFTGWKKLLARSQGVVIYWGRGQKEYLEKNVSRFLPAAKLGCAWYVTQTELDAEHKRVWPPSDHRTEIIVDEERLFSYERLQPFLKRVRERARL